MFVILNSDYEKLRHSQRRIHQMLLYYRLDSAEIKEKKQHVNYGIYKVSLKHVKQRAEKK